MTAVAAVAAVALGLALGTAYFGGLWWTLARLSRWRRPGWALAASFVVRGALLLAVLALLARQGVAPLLFALGGFLIARVALSAWLRDAGGTAAAAPERDPAGGTPWS